MTSLFAGLQANTEEVKSEVRKNIQTTIPPKSAIALVVKRGSIVRVIDIEGSQVADFVCFNETNHSEYFSQAKTRINNGRIRISDGDRLFSNNNIDMFEIVRDTVKVHDLMFPPCNTYLYEVLYHEPGREGCLENLASALQPYGINKGAVPDPFNIFMHTSVDESHRLQIHHPVSTAGDFIELMAQMDCLVAISSCAEDISDCNGHRCTAIGVEVE